MLDSFFFPTGARVVASWERPEPCDIRMATAWESAHIVHRSPNARRKGYFVQDFEAWFSAMGDGYIGAENTYRLGLECITIGRFLTNLIASRYGGSANYFDFTVDDSLYFVGEQARAPSPTVAFLYQPEKPRRCPWLGRETLGIVKHRMPETKILLYGSPESPNLWFEHENLRLVSRAQCAALYRQAWVGLCISASNPSRIPFEMMASGCAVVDIARENNAFDYEPGAITLAEPRPEALADAIVRLLQDGELRERQVRAGLDMMAKRQDQLAFDRVEELIMRLHETGTVRDGATLPQPRSLNVDPPAVATSTRESSVPRPGPRETATELISKARQKVKRIRDLGSRLDARLRTTLEERGRWPTASYATLWKEMSPLLAGRRVVAFDVFDTLLVRRVPPDTIKELVAHEADRLLRPYGVVHTWADLLALRKEIERDLCLGNQRAGLDDEFDYDTMLAIWLEAAGAPSDRRSELAAALRAHEEQVELAALEVHPAIPSGAGTSTREGSRPHLRVRLLLACRDTLAVPPCRPCGALLQCGLLLSQWQAAKGVRATVPSRSPGFSGSSPANS